MTNSTIAWIASHCRSVPIDEKWILVEHLRVGQQWKDRLTQTGSWHINLHARTMRLIVSELASPWLATGGSVPISHHELELLFDQVLQDLQATQRLTYFQISERAHHSLARLLARTYYDWRSAGLTADQLRPAAMEVPTKAADLTLIFNSIRERLARAGQVDYIDCIEGVIDALKHQRMTIPPGLVILQPESFPIAQRERELLDVLRECGALLCPPDTIPASTEPAPPMDVSLQVAVGEVNEVRGVWQHCLSASSGPIQLDQVEVLVADYERYAPLLLESLWQCLSSQADQESEKSGPLGIDSLPITFAEGIPCVYSRPGRLLRSWVRWAESDYLQSKAVQILREGLLARPASAATVGYARLASKLRSVPIGFGLDRYLPQIRVELAAAQRDAQRLAEKELEYQGDCGSSALEALLATIEPLISLAPKSDETAIGLLDAAGQLLERYARTESVVDRYARGKLLDDIAGMRAVLATHSNTLISVRAWLEELPARSRLFSSTPRPGALHVAPLEQGGASGRANVFLLGMDDRNFPRRPVVDPILLDTERTRISANLMTSDQLSSYQQAAVDRVWTRLQGIEKVRVHSFYSQLDLTDDSERFPSPILSRATAVDLSRSLSFLAKNESDVLTESEQFHRELLMERNGDLRAQRILERFPLAAFKQRASMERIAPLYGAYDGWVPQAGQDLLASATSRPMSPSRLEMLGTCPRKYFFARALGVQPPEEWTIDSGRWLTALDVGNLLHELFEDFLRELQTVDEIPDPARHSSRLFELLELKIAKMAEQVPVHSIEAFRRQREELVDTCEIFLQKEHDYAVIRNAKTWILEASLGSLVHSHSHAATPIDTDQPIIIELASGRKISLCGRIDRIDRVDRVDRVAGSDRTASGESAARASSNPDYVIWDYKTGSDWGFDQSQPIQQGRKLQSFLYTRMLAMRFIQLGSNPQSVRSFGYFFPSPRTEGKRYEWLASELAAGDHVLESMLDLLSAGTFIATNSKDDCGYCDFQRVCGSVDELVAISNLKTECPDNTQLAAWRTLRS